jgi:hypothetical protein
VHNDYVIGYDLLNDPWPASIEKSSTFDDVLAGLYEQIADVVRSTDQEKVLFFQPSSFPGVVP